MHFFFVIFNIFLISIFYTYLQFFQPFFCPLLLGFNEYISEIARVNAAIFNFFYKSCRKIFRLRSHYRDMEFLRFLENSENFQNFFLWEMLTTMELICFKLDPSLPFRQGIQPGHLRFRGQKIWRFWSILFIFANFYAFKNTKSLKRQSGIFVKIRYILLFLVFLGLFHVKDNLFIKFVKVFSMKFVPKVYKHKMFVKYLAFFRHVKVSARQFFCP